MYSPHLIEKSMRRVNFPHCASLSIRRGHHGNYHHTRIAGLLVVLIPFRQRGGLPPRFSYLSIWWGGDTLPQHLPLYATRASQISCFFFLVRGKHSLFVSHEDRHVSVVSNLTHQWGSSSCCYRFYAARCYVYTPCCIIINFHCGLWKSITVPKLRVY